MANVSSFRISPDNAQVVTDLGLLAGLVGTWSGRGFNLIARPNFQGNTALYLQLNSTHETLKFDAIGSPIPNRGLGQDDVTLFGVNYLQQVRDAGNDGALHIEPGLWVTQKVPPKPVYPPLNAAAPPGAEIIARLGSIPHGNALLAQGTAERFEGSPTIAVPGGSPYAFSKFPSFNSGPNPVGATPAAVIVRAAGSAESQINLPPPAVQFTQYTLENAATNVNTRTPFNTNPPEPEIPKEIDGVPRQVVVNDPIALLQKVVADQVAAGYRFRGTALNISTSRNITFQTQINNVAAGAPTTIVTLPTWAGGIENTLFLEGGEPVGAVGPNAQTGLVYATFWIEELTHDNYPPFLQLQYAQMTMLNFRVLGTPALLSWPHISVATLRKSFG